MSKYDDDLWALRKEADYLFQPKQRRIGEKMHEMVMNMTWELQQRRNDALVGGNR